MLARRENEPVSVVVADIDDAAWMPAVASVSATGGTGERRALLPDTVLKAVADCLGDGCASATCWPASDPAASCSCCPRPTPPARWWWPNARAAT